MYIIFILMSHSSEGLVANRILYHLQYYINTYLLSFFCHFIFLFIPIDFFYEFLFVLV